MTPYNRTQTASDNDNARMGHGGQRSMGRIASGASFAGYLLLGVAMSLGCDRILGPNQAQCDQSIATFRQAISFGQFESASQWREYSAKVCGNTPIVAAIGRELVEAKRKAEQEAVALKKRQREVAQSRINAAQQIWRKFDGLKTSERTASALAATGKSAKRQGKGLSEEMAKQLDDYNSQQLQLRKAQLKP